MDSDTDKGDKNNKLWNKFKRANRANKASSDTEVSDARSTQKYLEKKFLHFNRFDNQRGVRHERDLGQAPPPYPNLINVPDYDMNQRVVINEVPQIIPDRHINANVILQASEDQADEDSAKNQGAIKKMGSKIMQSISPSRKKEKKSRKGRNILDNLSEEDRYYLEAEIERRAAEMANDFGPPNYPNETTMSDAQYHDRMSSESSEEDDDINYPPSPRAMIDPDREQRHFQRRSRSFARINRHSSTGTTREPSYYSSTSRSRDTSPDVRRSYKDWGYATDSGQHLRTTRRGVKTKVKSEPIFNSVNKVYNSLDNSVREEETDQDEMRKDIHMKQHHNLLKDSDTVSIREVTETFNNTQGRMEKNVFDAVMAQLSTPKTNLLGIVLPKLASHKPIRVQAIDRLYFNNSRLIERLNPSTGSLKSFLENFHDTGLNSPEYNMYVHMYLHKDLQNAYQKRFPHDTPRKIDTLRYIQNLYEIHRPTSGNGGNIRIEIMNWKPKAAQSQNILEIYQELLYLLNESESGEISTEEGDKLLQSRIMDFLPPHIQATLQSSQTNQWTGIKTSYDRSQLFAFLKTHSRLINQYLRENRLHRRDNIRYVEDFEHSDAYQMSPNNPHYYYVRNTFMPPAMNAQYSQNPAQMAPPPAPQQSNGQRFKQQGGNFQQRPRSGKYIVKECTVCHKKGHLAEQCYHCPKNGMKNRTEAPWCILCRSTSHLTPECPKYGPHQGFSAPQCEKCYNHPNQILAFHRQESCSGVDPQFTASIAAFREKQRARKARKATTKN